MLGDGASSGCWTTVTPSLERIAGASTPPAEAPTATAPRSAPLRRVFVLAIVHWLPVPPLDNPFLGLSLGLFTNGAPPVTACSPPSRRRTRGGGSWRRAARCPDPCCTG